VWRGKRYKNPDFTNFIPISRLIFRVLENGRDNLGDTLSSEASSLLSKMMFDIRRPPSSREAEEATERGIASLLNLCNMSQLLT
jgi:hypothetical protein